MNIDTNINHNYIHTVCCSHIFYTVKGNRAKRSKWPENVQNVRMFCINGTDLIVLLLLIQKKYFVCLVLLFSCCCLLFCCCCCLVVWLVGWLLLLLLLYFFKFSIHRAQPCWFTFYQWRVEKSWSVTYLMLLTLMSILFMTSQIQTAAHKMAALTVAFFVAFKRRILYKLDQKQSDYIIFKKTLSEPRMTKTKYIKGLKWTLT